VIEQDEQEPTDDQWRSVPSPNGALVANPEQQQNQTAFVIALVRLPISRYQSVRFSHTL
jgi:hypothetical protein